MTFGSADKFHQVVINLVTNAIEAFHDVASEIDGRKIKISLATIRENIFLKVCDNACGISAEVLPMLFEPFFTTKNFGKQGVGIGLAITKQIIEKDFEGSIFAENNSDGGATFTVQFPLKREPIFH
jgi:C4-dicarboxylate-specific signal transduction histidine kinase